jgi:DNA repair exonuclease SbcCD nuclease subunit
MELSFIHTGDIHLCNNFDSISLSEKERELRRKELWEAFDKIIDLSMENEVDYLFIAGDLICSK